MTIPRLLCLGDSYTIGEGVPGEDNWPNQLQQALLEVGLQVHSPAIIAQTGWSASELEQAIKDTNPAGPFELVTLLIGVNDQYRGHSIETFLPSYGRLLQRAVALVEGMPDRVLAISIPDWGTTPFAHDRDQDQVAEEINAFNRAEAQICKEHQITWVNITESSRELNMQPEMLVADQLHPSGLQYARWVELMVPLILQKLERDISI